MPMLSIKLKRQIERENSAIINLEERCASCKLFDGKVADSVYVYSASNYDDSYETEADPAMVAVAVYDKTLTALYLPAYITEKQTVILGFLLRNADPDDQIVVFSQRDYDAVQKYKYSKPIKVQLVK